MSTGFRKISCTLDVTVSAARINHHSFSEAVNVSWFMRIHLFGEELMTRVNTRNSWNMSLFRARVSTENQKLYKRWVICCRNAHTNTLWSNILRCCAQSKTAEYATICTVKLDNLKSYLPIQKSR